MSPRIFREKFTTCNPASSGWCGAADASSKMIRRVSKFRAQQWASVPEVWCALLSPSTAVIDCDVPSACRNDPRRSPLRRPHTVSAQPCCGMALCPPRTQIRPTAPPVPFAASRSVELNSSDDVQAVLAREILIAFPRPGFTPWVFQTKVGGHSVRQAAGENTKLDKLDGGKVTRPARPEVTPFLEAGLR